MHDKKHDLLWQTRIITEVYFFVVEASLKIENITVGEQITAEQLIEKRKVITISKAVIMNIGITSMSSRLKRFRI